MRPCSSMIRCDAGDHRGVVGDVHRERVHALRRERGHPVDAARDGVHGEALREQGAGGALADAGGTAGDQGYRCAHAARVVGEAGASQPSRSTTAYSRSALAARGPVRVAQSENPGERAAFPRSGLILGSNDVINVVHAEASLLEPLPSQARADDRGVRHGRPGLPRPLRPGARGRRGPRGVGRLRREDGARHEPVRQDGAALALSQVKRVPHPDGEILVALSLSGGPRRRRRRRGRTSACRALRGDPRRGGIAAREARRRGRC